MLLRKEKDNGEKMSRLVLLSERERHDLEASAS